MKLNKSDIPSGDCHVGRSYGGGRVDDASSYKWFTRRGSHLDRAAAPLAATKTPRPPAGN